MRRQELHPRTASINKLQKNESKKIRNQALAWLAMTFPEAFDNTTKIRPLKIGIMHDILEHAEQAAEVGISRSKLREAVVLFTRRLDYLACLKAKEARIDLAGNTVAMVTEDEAEKASAKIKKRIEKSVRNAKKLMPAKPANYRSEATRTGSSFNTSAGYDYPTYSERAPAFSSAMSTNKPAPTVVVRHKGTRQYDPSAVARLKEKLGLSQKNLKADEVSE